MAQPLAAPETGELLTSLLQQGFVVAPCRCGPAMRAGARLLRGRCPAAGLRRCAGGESPSERGAREGRGPAAGHGRDPGPLHRRRGSRVAALVSAPWAGSRSRARHVSRRALTGGDRGLAPQLDMAVEVALLDDLEMEYAAAPMPLDGARRRLATAAADALGAGDLRKPEGGRAPAAARRIAAAPSPGVRRGCGTGQTGSRALFAGCQPVGTGSGRLPGVRGCASGHRQRPAGGLPGGADGEQGGMTTGSRAGCGTGAGIGSRWHRTGSIFICPPAASRGRMMTTRARHSGAARLPDAGEACSAE